MLQTAPAVRGPPVARPHPHRCPLPQAAAPKKTATTKPAAKKPAAKKAAAAPKKA